MPTAATTAAAPQADPVELAQAPGEAIGQVSAVEGAVTITHPDGTKVQATTGAPIFQGDLVETKGDGAVGITFADDTTFSLADNGSMTIDQMVYDPATQKGKAALSVAEGVFTFVSGQIAKTDVDAMSIKTPVATIGIRGTAGGGKAGPEGTPNTFSMFADPNGNLGEMSIRTQGGNVIFSKALQTTQVASAFVPPLQPIVLPPSVAAQFYAKAAGAAPIKPVIGAPAGATGDQGGPGGNQGGATGDQGGPGGTQGGPGGDQGGPPPAAEAAAEAAAAEAFANALAAGGSLDAAIGAAAGAAATAALATTLAANPEAFGTAAAAQSVLTSVVAQSLGSLAASLGPVGGIGPGGLAGGAGGDVLGAPPAAPPPAIVIQFVPPPPPPPLVIVLPPPDEPPPDQPPPVGGNSGAAAVTVAELVSAVTGGFSGLGVVAGSSNFQGNLTGTSAATFASVSLGTVNGISYSISGGGVLLTSGGLPGTTNTSTAFSGIASGQPVQVTAGSGLNGQFGGEPIATTTDSTVLSLRFTISNPNATYLVFDWMYGTEEYPDQTVTDIAAIVVDGSNYLKFPADDNFVQFRDGTTNTPGNAASFANNSGGALATEYDGVVRPGVIAAFLDTNVTTHTLDIVVADTSDQVLDSALWVAARGLALTTIGNRDVTSGNDILVSETANDTVDESATGGNNTIFLLGTGSNTYEDGAGNDTVYGGAGNETFNLGGGTNVASGGRGNDLFSIATSAAANNTVFGGDTTSDQILFTPASQAITVTVGTATTTVAHGTGLGSTVFAEVEQLNGSNFNDTITINVDITAGALKTIEAGSGNDTFTIGAAANVSGANLQGETGTDTLDLSARTDNVSANLTGTTTAGVTANSLAVGSGTATILTFENILTGTGQDTVVVNGLTLSGNTINGGANTTNDELDIIGASTVTLTDTQLVNVTNWSEWRLPSSITYSLTTDDANVAAGQSLTVNLTGASGTLVFNGAAETNGTFNVIGNANADTLTGGAGNDSITGGGGADTLSGGGGDDTFLFGASNFAAGESVDGGAGTDTLSVSGSNTFQAGTLAGIETLTYTATATATFGSGQVGTGQIATVNGNNGTVNTLTVNTTSNLDVSGVTFNNWESTDVINLAGSTANNTIVGSDQADNITGANGTDTLTGGAGNDTFLFAAGDFQGDGPGLQADESVNGGTGTDTLSLSGGNDFTLGTLASIEALTFTAGATATFSGSQVNTAAQLASALAVTASAGSDAVVVNLSDSGQTVDLANWTFTNWAAAGTDTITINGGTGADDINGSSRNDTINGKGGGDTLSGDPGADVVNLNAGSGGDSAADTVVYHTLNDGAPAGSLVIASADDINDFETANDKISFDQATCNLVNTTVATNGVASGAADLSTASVFYINDQTATDLSSFADVSGKIGTIAGANAGENAIFAVRTSTQTGVYAFTAAGADNNTIESGELRLLAVVDALLDDTNFAVDTGVA